MDPGAGMFGEEQAIPILFPHPAPIRISYQEGFLMATMNTAQIRDNASKAAARYTVNGEADSQYGRVWWIRNRSIT